MAENWRTYGDTTLEAFAASLPSGSHIKAQEEVEAVYNAARPHTRLFRGFLQAESSGATDFDTVPASMNNPVNLRTRGQAPFQRFASIADAAAEWNARLNDPSYSYANTVTLSDLIGIYAPSYDNNDEVNYAKTVLATMDKLPRIAQQPTQGGTTMVDANFLADLIPAGNSNRPGFLLNTDDRLIGITQHTTGNTNPSATAYMHRDFTHGGGGPDNVSFHFVVDDQIIIQLLPVYEGAYHAADGCDDRATDIGCFDTVAIELCVNSGANWTKAKDNLSRLYAMLWTGDKRIIGIDRVTVQNGRVYTHQQVSDTNKYCPQQILDEGSLPVIVAQGQTYAGASPVIPGPVYVKPIIPSWLANDDGVTVQKINNVKVYPVHLTYTAIRDTPRKQATGRNQNLVGPDITKGETFQAGRAYRSAGKTYILTTYGTRVTAADLVPRVQITKSGVVSIRYE